MSDDKPAHIRGASFNIAGSTGADEEITHRFWLLLTALTALLIGYPYFEDTVGGASLGGVAALLTLTTAVYAIRTKRWAFRGSLMVALAAATASIAAFLAGVRGNPIVEGTFSIFYAYMTTVVFLEVIKFSA